MPCLSINSHSWVSGLTSLVVFSSKNEMMSKGTNTQLFYFQYFLWENDEMGKVIETMNYWAAQMDLVELYWYLCFVWPPNLLCISPNDPIQQQKVSCSFSCQPKRHHPETELGRVAYDLMRLCTSSSQRYAIAPSRPLSLALIQASQTAVRCFIRRPFLHPLRVFRSKVGLCYMLRTLLETNSQLCWCYKTLDILFKWVEIHILWAPFAICTL